VRMIGFFPSLDRISEFDATATVDTHNRIVSASLESGDEALLLFSHQCSTYYPRPCLMATDSYV